MCVGGGGEALTGYVLLILPASLFDSAALALSRPLFIWHLDSSVHISAGSRGDRGGNIEKGAH